MSGKTALITGASAGIGRELARVHAQRGGGLIVVARRRDRLEQLKSELEQAHAVRVTVIPKDLVREEAPREIYDEVKDAGLQVDYLINNAGFGGLGKFHERDLEKDLAMIKVNILALTALTRLFLPGFIARNEGRIMNVSSTASLTPGPHQAVYYATKAYVSSLSNAVGEELHDTHVTVTNLMPGATQTEFAQVSGLTKTSIFNNMANAAVVARKGYDGMLAGKRDVIPEISWTLRLMLAVAPFVPKGIRLQQVRKMQEVRA